MPTTAPSSVRGPIIRVMSLVQVGIMKKGAQDYSGWPTKVEAAEQLSLWEDCSRGCARRTPLACRQSQQSLSARDSILSYLDSPRGLGCQVMVFHSAS